MTQLDGDIFHKGNSIVTLLCDTFEYYLSSLILTCCMQFDCCLKKLKKISQVISHLAHAAHLDQEESRKIWLNYSYQISKFYL